MLRVANRIVLALALLAQTACGFHLRGPAQINENLNPLFLEKESLQAEEQTLVEKALSRAGVRLIDSALNANRLYVSFSPLRRRNLAQSSPTGVQLVQLSMQLDYRVQSSVGEPLIESRELARSTEIELDNANVLSHEKLLKNGVTSLRKKLLQGMIYQLNR